MNRIAVFPGTFDPITVGHVDIITRASSMFDKIIIAVGENSQKKTLFTLADRIGWINFTFDKHPKIEIAAYEGLTVNFCKQAGAHFLLRGLRNGSDFDYESHIAQLNKTLWKDIETVFIMCSPELGYISSSLVRDLIIHKGDFAQYLPKGVIPQL